MAQSHNVVVVVVVVVAVNIIVKKRMRECLEGGRGAKPVNNEISVADRVMEQMNHSSPCHPGLQAI